MGRRVAIEHTRHPVGGEAVAEPHRGGVDLGSLLLCVPIVLDTKLRKRLLDDERDARAANRHDRRRYASGKLVGLQIGAIPDKTASQEMGDCGTRIEPERTVFGPIDLGKSEPSIAHLAAR